MRIFRDFRRRIFTEDLTDHNDVVEVLDIEFVSMCEHHLLPFLGTLMWHLAWE